MSDKTFELLEKMYVEFSSKFENLGMGVKENSKEILKLENEISNKFGALFDAHNTTNG